MQTARNVVLCAVLLGVAYAGLYFSLVKPPAKVASVPVVERTPNVAPLPPTAPEPVPVAELAPATAQTNEAAAAPLPPPPSPVVVVAPPTPTKVPKGNSGGGGGGKKEWQDPTARVALALVGVDPAAEEYWTMAINNPTLPPNERKDLIEDLNEEGIDPKHLTPDDAPLILSRLSIIERNFPLSMDDVNADAFAEAYKDLLNMLARCQ